MRKVKIYGYVKNDLGAIKVPLERIVDHDVADFHCFGSDFEELEVGAGNYSVAICELPNGKIVTPLPGDIEFIGEK